MAQAQLPDLSQLLTDAWKLTKERFWLLLLLWLVQWTIITLIVIGAIALSLGGSLGSLFTSPTKFTAITTAANNNDFMTAFLASFGSAIITAILILLLISLILGPFFQAADIALAAGKKKIGIGEALRRGWQQFIPVLVAGLVMAFMVFGGLFPLVVPGIVFAILFNFALFEIVLHNASPMQALRNSAGMVKQHFWPVVGRLVVLMALAVGIEVIRASLNRTQQPLSLLISLALSLSFSAFSLMYSVALYKQLKAVAAGATLKLNVITIFSVIGWTGLFLLIANAVRSI
ncbi:MAG: hypothetical protein UY13_C0002G0065 [Candidatus Pacebacteria bacterium GW2011_GWB1_47_8]|nr:MAG: hypothetical protein UX28_C0001G0213 [Candidatus Pacebacteria bacterium GW2011_GWA1_46_10]KKU84153.1 MAG: hypothetical protein UY13_C0002G0065 [Candidatus Pacebacteria bacterium GW2011_GWB1_47_8]HCR80888.1 hypothetical protein [Candidatus Paceibacterota bacterium]